MAIYLGLDPAGDVGPSLPLVPQNRKTKTFRYFFPEKEKKKK